MKILDRAKLLFVRSGRTLVADRRGSSELTVPMIMTLAGLAAVTTMLPSMFESGNIAADTVKTQAQALQNGATGGGGSAGSLGGSSNGWSLSCSGSGCSVSGDGVSASVGSNGVSVGAGGAAAVGGSSGSGGSSPSNPGAGVVKGAGSLTSGTGTSLTPGAQAAIANIGKPAGT